MSAPAAAAAGGGAAAAAAGGVSVRPRCPFGSKCYRKNPDHIRDFEHCDAPPVEADITKKHCPYGWQCFRKNLQHRADEYHAPAPRIRPLSPFPTPFEEPEYGDVATSTLPPKTLREIAMLRMEGAIMEKPMWYEKIHDATITAKWTREALEQSQLTLKSIKYLLEEVKWRAANRQDGIDYTAIDGVFQADGLIPGELKAQLIAEVAHLENVPEDKLDWHPGTNKQVLDLVHPSMYCYRIGKSSVVNPPFKLEDALTMFGQGKPMETAGEAALAAAAAAASGGKRQKRPHQQADYSTSNKFQWLPAEFEVDDDGQTKITSYINNLHPVDHAACYPVLSSIFSRFLPLFERVLTGLKQPRPMRIHANAYDWYDRPDGWVDPEKEKEAYLAKGAAAAGGEEAKEGETAAAVAKDALGKLDADDVDMATSTSKKPSKVRADGADDDMEDAEDEEEEDEDDDDDDNRPIFLPDVSGAFHPHVIPPDGLVKLAGRTLQVIVKLATIHLTPESPSYPGGSWHVEGMRNEAIVASGIYYVSAENITESRLAFRQACAEPDYEQSDDRGVAAVYGLGNEEALNQELGSVVTQADRCLAFPNILQHQVQPFKLADKTKPGVRKIIVFFLCDPAARVISSAIVPPQQANWLLRAQTPWHTELLATTSLIDPLVRIVLDYSLADQVMTVEQAEEVREELMQERKFFVQQNSERLFEREFSLCEH